ncbi:MAG: dTMP kinase [Pirellulaceae bacterium]
MNAGIFVVFEGIDGAGKTTQIQRLAGALRQLGEDLVCSREPTGGYWGRRLRDSATSGRMPLDQELAAFIADRKEHLQDVIQPAVARGAMVIVDRYFYSTIAYQGARGGDVAAITREMESFAPIPDIVLLIDIDPELATRRIADSRGEMPNQFERADYLAQVRRIFHELARRPEVRLINGQQSADAVFSDVCRALIQGPLAEKRAHRRYDAAALQQASTAS